MFKSFLYGSFFYPRRALWSSGVIIFLLTILTSFLGYVLPWGQMSYWAATVITNLASAVPMIGQKIVYWLWSGFSVDQPTLNKFLSLHYLMPFVIAALVILHFILLHKSGSSSPLGLAFKTDSLPFHPYYIIKDFSSAFLFFFALLFLVAFLPNLLGHPDNYLEANPDVTPEHIVPEWYFLPFYAILRSIPNKLIGVIALLLSILILLFLPYLNFSRIRSLKFKPVTTFFSAFFILDSLLLGYIGQCPLEEPFSSIGFFATVFYFSFFLMFFLVDVCDYYLFSFLIKRK